MTVDATPATPRHPGLDAARAIAMLLVVATHAALSFMVTPIGWAIQDRSRSLGVDLLVWIVRAFAMPSFFWLSGYFSRAIVETGGLAGFVRHRITRIVVPLAVAVVPCSLVLGALWHWGREVGVRGAVADNIPKLQPSELPIVLGHLWFLYYLLWISAAAIVLRQLGRAFDVSRSTLGILAVPAILTCGVLVAQSAIHVDTPLGFVPDLPILVYMGAFFAWGWLVQARPGELGRYATHAFRALAIAPVFLGVVIATLYRGLAAVEDAPIYASVASALFTIAIMIAFLGGCVRYARRPHQVVRVASEASYWWYIVHLPIVVALQIVVAPLAIPGVLKYLAIVVVTTAGCVASYALVVRRRRLARTSRSS